jgi:hypothetical protein
MKPPQDKPSCNPLPTGRARIGSALFHVYRSLSFRHFRRLRFAPPLKPLQRRFKGHLFMRNQALYYRRKVAFSNVAPVWLLVYWRLVKGEAEGDFATAWRLLPQHLPAGVSAPSIEEAAVILIDHGLMR